MPPAGGRGERRAAVRNVVNLRCSNTGCTFKTHSLRGLATHKSACNKVRNDLRQRSADQARAARRAAQQGAAGRGAGAAGALDGEAGPRAEAAAGAGAAEWEAGPPDDPVEAWAGAASGAADAPAMPAAPPQPRAPAPGPQPAPAFAITFDPLATQHLLRRPPALAAGARDGGWAEGGGPALGREPAAAHGLPPAITASQAMLFRAIQPLPLDAQSAVLRVVDDMVADNERPAFTDARAFRQAIDGERVRARPAPRPSRRPRACALRARCACTRTGLRPGAVRRLARCGPAPAHAAPAARLRRLRCAQLPGALAHAAACARAESMAGGAGGHPRRAPHKARPDLHVQRHSQQRRRGGAARAVARPGGARAPATAGARCLKRGGRAGASLGGLQPACGAPGRRLLARSGARLRTGRGRRVAAPGARLLGAARRGSGLGACAQLQPHITGYEERTNANGERVYMDLPSGEWMRRTEVRIHAARAVWPRPSPSRTRRAARHRPGPAAPCGAARAAQPGSQRLARPRHDHAAPCVRAARRVRGAHVRRAASSGYGAGPARASAQARVREAHGSGVRVAAFALWSDSSPITVGTVEYNAGVLFPLWLPQHLLRLKAAYRPLWMCAKITADQLDLDGAGLSDNATKKLCAPRTPASGGGRGRRRSHARAGGLGRAPCAAPALLTPHARARAGCAPSTRACAWRPPERCSTRSSGPCSGARARPRPGLRVTCCCGAGHPRTRAAS